MLIEKKNKTLIRRFDSIDELVNIQVSKINEYHSSNINLQEQKRYSQISWFGISGGTDEIDKIYKEGWSEGWSKAEEILNEITYDLPMPVQQKKRRTFKDNGDFIDMQRVYAGALDTAWITSEKKPIVGHPTIKILTAIGGNCNRSNTELFYKGVCAVILTDILENLGFRVEIEGYSHGSDIFSSKDGCKNVYETFPLKHANDPLDRLKLITVTALSGFFRTYIFRSRMSTEYIAKSGLGITEEHPFDVVDDKTILLTNIYNKESAIRLINDSLKKFNNQN